MKKTLMLGGAALGMSLMTTGSVGAMEPDPNPPGLEPTPVVETASGPVRGRIQDGVAAFKGIRYGAAPVGERRFLPPADPEIWSEVFQADMFGNACIQSDGQPDMPSYETHSEDCLFLNVWSPDLSGDKPVMVWLHGGGFTSGAAVRPTYWGEDLAREDVVVVSLNHRLNVFGYTQLPESWGAEYESSGLSGMLDIVQALEWVQANIEQFGGDPDNVTIFGESGGGAKVSLLLGMPGAKGLFDKAIIQSGAALDAAPHDYAAALGGALMDRLEVAPGNVEQLAALDTQAIFEAQAAAAEDVRDLQPDGFLSGGFVPNVDGKVLPRGPFTPEASPLAADIPLLIGTNKDENTLFLAFDPGFGAITMEDFEAEVRKRYPESADEVIETFKATYPDYEPPYLMAALDTADWFWLNTLKLADRKLEQDPPVYVYRMDWGHNFLKAAHALELSFVFGTFDYIRDFVGPGEGPARMTEQMQPAWAAFAHTGDPNHAGIPDWPAYNVDTRPTMIFNLDSEVQQDPFGELREVLLGAEDEG
ncbi:carboxylesterase/lipase family protein [Parvularcula oceani]|uniref:carboxylesterase/lipase family protein n=1 Tax=Parvularcula oceani TaxID=1247963 RepID=UPI000B24738D|nr:carboxylesterase/lipase family protein [Parvularcula oceani]